MQTRRTLVLSSLVMPFAWRGALAIGSANSALLLGRIGVDKTLIPLEGEFAVSCSLEARRRFCRVYVPLRWANNGGFKLVVAASGGKTGEPQFHPSPALPLPGTFAQGSHYRDLDVGESVSFRTRMKARDVFPSAGVFTLGAVYLPEPPAKLAVGQAIVSENGTVETGTVQVKVV